MSAVVDRGIADKKHGLLIAKLFVKLVQIAVGLYLVQQAGFHCCGGEISQWISLLGMWDWSWVQLQSLQLGD